MNRLSYWIYRCLSWARYTIPRRFTPAGVLALVAILTSGALGIDMDRTVAYQAFALAVCLIAVAMSAAPFFRGRFSVERVLPRFASAGEPFLYHVRVRNLTEKHCKDLELLENLVDPRPTYREFVESHQVARLSFNRRARTRFQKVRSLLHLHLTPSPPLNSRRAVTGIGKLPEIPPRTEVSCRMELLPLHRGALRLAGATIARTDPFGLFRGFARVLLRQTVIVLPKRYPLPAITLPGARQYQRGGMSLASAIGESEEFVSLRDYRPGDPPRLIHWRSWARLGRPVVKEFQDEFFVRHALILDTFVGPERAEALEEAVSVAASFASTVTTQESLLDLMLVGAQAVCFTTGRGVGQAEQALEILAGVRACSDKPFRSLQNLVLLHASGVCGCICVLLDWDEPRRELVRQLQGCGLPLLVLVVVEAGPAEELRRHALDRPEHFVVIETGRVGADLQKLEGLLG